MNVTVYLPDSEPGPEAAQLAPSPSSLAGLRIAVLDNGKPNAALVMTRAGGDARGADRRTGVARHQEGTAGPLGQRGDPVRARHLRTRARTGRRGDHRLGRLRQLHRVQRVRHHRAREGRATVRRRDHDAVRADRRDHGRQLRAARSRARSCSTTRSAAPPVRLSKAGPTPRRTASSSCSPAAPERPGPDQVSASSSRTCASRTTGCRPRATSRPAPTPTRCRGRTRQPRARDAVRAAPSRARRVADAQRVVEAGARAFEPGEARQREREVVGDQRDHRGQARAVARRTTPR